MYSHVRINDHVRKLVLVYFLRQYTEHPFFAFVKTYVLLIFNLKFFSTTCLL